MKLFIHWLISALAIGIVAYLLPGADVTPVGALVAAVVIAIINVFIRPLILALTLPLNVLTLGLFTLIINALLVMLAAAVVPGFDIGGFWWAFLFAILLAIVNAVFNTMEEKHA